MPRNKDGSITRARFTKLKLQELSGVDRPAQPGALMSIMKRDDSEDDKITKSLDKLIAEVKGISPDLSKSLERLISRKGADMPKENEQLEAEISTLKAKVEKAEGERDAALAAQKAAEEAKEAAEKALTEATDEVIKVGDAEVRKSQVGEAQFAVTKALADERDLARLEKRAETEYGHVVGKADEKAKVLKAIDAIADEDVRKAAVAILDSAEKMTCAAFDTLGHREEAPSVKKSRETFDAKVSELVAKGVKKTDAMSQVRTENPELYEEAFGAQ